MPVECVVSRSGGPDVLTVREKSREVCGPGQVRIEVRFAGANFADLAARAGLYGPAPAPPFAPGFEVSGVVVESGEGSGFAVGDRVFAGTRFGGYTSELVVDGVRARRLPDAMSFEEGAALLTQYLTAHHALTRVAHARAGEVVLIHACAGGVGTAAVQLAKAMGCVTVGTSSTDEKLAYAKGQGLDVGINYAREDFEKAVSRRFEHGVDVALDANGGASFGKSFRCLAKGGRLVVYGAAAALPSARTLEAVREWPRAAWTFARQRWFHPFELIERNVTVAGFQLLLLWDKADLLGTELDELLALYGDGKVRPVVDRVFPLAEAAVAHRYLAERRTRGKVLLAP